MWKYNYTDAMYTGQYWSPNELCHRQHKYIKRVKVNGKWRYYYNDDIERSYKKAKDSYTYAKKQTDTAHDISKRVEYNDGTRLIWIGDEPVRAYKPLTLKKIKNMSAHYSEWQKAAYKLEKAKDTYKNTAISRLSAKVAVKGLNFVSNLIDSIKKTAKKLTKKK